MRVAFRTFSGSGKVGNVYETTALKLHFLSETESRPVVIQKAI